MNKNFIPASKEDVKDFAKRELSEGADSTGTGNQAFSLPEEFTSIETPFLKLMYLKGMIEGARAENKSIIIKPEYIEDIVHSMSQYGFYTYKKNPEMASDSALEGVAYDGKFAGLDELKIDTDYLFNQALKKQHELQDLHQVDFSKCEDERFHGLKDIKKGVPEYPTM